MAGDSREEYERLKRKYGQIAMPDAQSTPQTRPVPQPGLPRIRPGMQRPMPANRPVLQPPPFPEDRPYVPERSGPSKRPSPLYIGIAVVALVAIAYAVMNRDAIFSFLPEGGDGELAQSEDDPAELEAYYAPLEKGCDPCFEFGDLAYVDHTRSSVTVKVGERAIEREGTVYGTGEELEIGLNGCDWESDRYCLASVGYTIVDTDEMLEDDALLT